MTLAKFRFSTGILKALGEELNDSADQSILELVKNAYDADAINCVVELHHVEKSGGSIVITDDGCGMDSADIVDGWLLLGQSRKRTTQRTALGRVPAGNKGLGRLAALRMGQGVALSTVSKSDLYQEYDLYVDWSLFDTVETVDQVNLQLDSSPLQQAKPHGTEIIIEGLKKPIDRRTVKRLARALILLANPFDDDAEGFKPRLETSQYSDLAALVQNRYFEQADYHLHAEVDENGFTSAVVRDFKGEILFSATHEELASRRGGKAYDCPVAQFDIWIFLLSAKHFTTRNVTIREVRDWLKAFGGVHLYENGLRVQPYGNPGNDWLDINLARAKQHEENPSTNTVIGRVSIQNLDQLLIQKTDRTGYIEDDSFIELRTFAQDALHWLYRRRLAVAQIRRNKQKKQTNTTASQKGAALQALINQSPEQTQEPLKRSYREYKSARDREVNQLRKEVQLYRTLSTAGITTATFAHESSGNPLKVIAMSIGTVERRAQKDNPEKYEARLKPPVERIKNSVDSLAVLGNSTLKLLAHDKRRIGRVNIHAVIDEVLTTFAPFLKIRQVKVEKQFF